MSKNRIKSVGYEDDFLDGDEDEDNELSAEDREQMAQGTLEVRQLLQSESPPIKVTDEEIWESLWHYYYDVDKTVGYLRKKKRAAEPAKKKTPAATQPKKSGIGTLTTSHYPIPTASKPEPHYPCSAQLSLSLSVRDFFRDSPWLNVPAHRKADILIEPLYPRLGLLGGAGDGTGKMSKLAALAAARKKREAEKRGNQNGGDNDATADAGGESAASKATDDQRSKSISLLDRLATNGKPSTSGATQARVPKFPLRKDGRDRDRERERGVVERKGREIAQSPTKQAPQEPVPAVTETSVEAAGPNEEEDRISSPLEDLRAEPSTFAAIILGETTSSDSPVSKQNAPVHNFFDFVVQDVTEVFNFAEPSPDDVVLNAQNTAKNNKSKRTTAQQSASKSQGDLADNVKQLSVQEKVKSKNLNVLEEHRKATRKKAANFVVIGHVDAGKSTLMGRLLFDLKAVDQRTLEKYRREADKIGKGSFALAWVLDQGSEERARGVTIDIATNKFETETTSFTVLDAPGHRDFVPNMIAGASQADFAVLVVDSSTGNFESGLKGQTKEHALLVRSMGVQKIVVAVNKMDAVNWSKDRFDEIEQQVSSFLTTAGFQARNISSVPCSGLSGDNVARKSEAKSSAWYTGNTLVEELETSEPYSYALDKPLRMTISDIFRGGVQHPLSISGRLDAGSLQIGDQVVTMPSRETATIKGVEVDQEPSDWAVAGQNVVLHLTDIDPVHLKTGDLICSPTSPVQNITSFTAKVLAFDHVTPMHIDVHRGTLYVPGRITKLVATLDKASGAAMKKKPKIVAPGTVARVVVEMERAIPLEAPARVVFRASGETVAAGLLE